MNGTILKIRGMSAGYDRNRPERGRKDHTAESNTGTAAPRRRKR